MALDGCGQICKCILIIFNIIFALVGLAMLGLGLWIRLSSETKGIFDINLNTQAFVIGVTVLIVLGAVLLLVAVFGEYGGCSENRTALGVFACLLSILTGLQIAAGVIAYVQRNEVGKQMVDFYISVYSQYVNKRDPGLSVTLTIIQNTLQCCGIIGALDPFVKKTCPETGFLETFTFPACPTVILNLFESKGPLVMGLFFGIAAMLILALVCSSILAKQIKTSRLPFLVHNT
ncbi:CD9 antigen-like [Esox lucius]|uniref:Tetraspanin n=1 Tax=Esox lucius TaxID=8010 RepID=A0A3P8ZTV7_ESOLU|nr:CD9 antigen-like [Esox lucius]XP_028979237.2 CD9 antigen-like [Esox lucius]